ncbi:MAG: Tricorn protease [Calditrichaeota bacterium]|nr:Tricorn protease [Calditrichota bacterium]
MRRVFPLFSAILILLFAASASATEAFMPRYPALSPDGSTIVFSFQGDLWSVPATGGAATRLTAHPAYDAHPVFSPDGSKIAFASERYDDVDVFMIPAGGGAPARLTFASTTDTPLAFGADGELVYFESSRMFDYPMSRQIQYVPAGGGTPFRFLDTFGNELAVSADGGRFVFTEGRLKFGRIKYRGTYQRDLFNYVPGQDPYPLTVHDGVDTQPMIHPDGRVFWVTDAGTNQVRNLWLMDAGGANKRQVTAFAEDGVRSAKMSADGSRIVLERGTNLYVLDLPGTEPREIEIDVAADLIENPVSIETFTAGADELTVTSDGEEFALVINGEIVLVNKEIGGRAAVPIPGPSREEEVAFRPGEGADTLAFITDRFGEKTLCLLVSADPDEPNLRRAREHRIVELTNGKRPASNPVWSPDGDRIAYTLGNADIHVIDHDGGGDFALSEHWAEPQYSWAPDGNWIAFSRDDRNFNSDIWIIPAEGGDPVNISQHPDTDSAPVWAADGSMIAWSTRRHDNQYDVYYLYLTEELDERTREEWEIWEKTRDDKPKQDDDEEAGEEEAEEEFRVEIDFEDIHLRARRATSSPNAEFAVAIHPKGDKIFFEGGASGERDLIAVNRFGEDEENITSGGTNPNAYTFDSENETFYFLTHGKPGYVGMDGGSVETTDFRARVTIDKPAMRMQILDEGWRVLSHWFYDPEMHGVDWPALREKYSEWAKEVAHDEDFADVVNIMLGELNASHMGYYPSWGGGNNGPGDGYIGVEFDSEYDGDGLRVAWVLPDGPADEEDMRLEPGDIVRTVNDMPVSVSDNLFAALEYQQEIPVPITWTRDGDEHEGMIVPVSWREIRGLIYRNMQKKKRSRTEEISDDRVGYVHIQGMGWSEVERFEMNLYAVADDKQALVIDVRDNGGGWTTDMLLTILTQPVHAYTIARDGEVGYPQPRYPMYRWEKPVAVICNAGSYSNAEIFSHAIRTIDRGPLVGEETGGNVISTGGWRTLDGGWIRMPFRGWYVWGDENDPSRNNKNQEAPGAVSGAVPDFPVELSHADRIADRDPQLEKAVQLMIEAAQARAQQSKPSDYKGDRNYDRP